MNNKELIGEDTRDFLKKVDIICCFPFHYNWEHVNNILGRKPTFHFGVCCNHLCVTNVDDGGEKIHSK